jgi:hypothetical protein
VNAGAGAGASSFEELLSPEAATFPAGLSGSEVTVAAFASRAGAGALAALDPNPPELAREAPMVGVGDRMSDSLAVILVPGAAVAGETISSMSKISASLSLSAGTEATTLGCGGF